MPPEIHCAAAPSDDGPTIVRDQIRHLGGGLPPLGSPIFQLARTPGPGVRNGMMDDRRAAPRQAAYLSAALETSQGRKTIAITRDLSSTGLLILTRLELVVGEIIKLTVAFDGSQHVLSARVVRLEEVEPHEIWRYRAALTVDNEDPVLAELQATLAAQAKAS